MTKVGQGFGKVLKVLGVTPVSAEPGEGALDHPAARQDDEALHVVAPLDDLPIRLAAAFLAIWGPALWAQLIPPRCAALPAEP